MQLTRVDVISLFDLNLDRRSLSSENIGRLERGHTNHELAEAYADSFEWLFYGEGLPGLRRFCFPPGPNDQRSRGSCLLLDSQHGLGVYSVWQVVESHYDPLQLKGEAWTAAGAALAHLDELGLDLGEVERHYPFVAIQVPTDDLAQFCSDEAAWLGKIFTGDLEHEEPERLANHIKSNVSWRDYERLIIRWTEALGVYRRPIEGDNDKDKHMYELTLLRAVQVFETCILVRRWLRNIVRGAGDVGASLAWYRPRPWAVNHLLESFARLESDFVVSPPVQSVEADVVLRRAYGSFGIPAMVEATRKSCEVLERRYQWTKTQLLVGIGVFTFLLDRLKIVEALYRYLGWAK